MNQQIDAPESDENGPYKTASGRAIQFGGLRLSFTWSGLLSGDPAELTIGMRKDGFAFYSKQMREDYRSDSPVVVIDEGWTVLPDLCWTAYFSSDAIVSDEDDDDWDIHSALCVCWFSQDLPTDFQQMLIDVAKKLNWEEKAKDYTMFD